MREIEATIQHEKPIVLVCDRMFESGNVLEQQQSECPERFQLPIFGAQSDPRRVLPWLRLPVFQHESLRLIAMELLKEMPLTRGRHIEVFMAKSIRLSKLEFQPPATMQYSTHNPVRSLVLPNEYSSFPIPRSTQLSLRSSNAPSCGCYRGLSRLQKN